MTSDLTAQVAFVLLEHAEADVGGQPVVRLSHEVIAQLVRPCNDPARMIPARTATLSASGGEPASQQRLPSGRCRACHWFSPETSASANACRRWSCCGSSGRAIPATAAFSQR